MDKKDIFFDTNIIKLESDKYSVAERMYIPIKQDVAPGDMLITDSGVLGVSLDKHVCDKESGCGVYSRFVYAADKIRLRFKGKCNKGDLLGAIGDKYSEMNGLVVLVPQDKVYPPHQYTDIIFLQAIALEDKDTNGEIEWVLCDLLKDIIPLKYEPEIT